jgi:hypothetical protein
MTGRTDWDRTVYERLRAMSDNELGTELTALGSALAWPATPDIASTVRTRLELPPSVWRGLGQTLFGRPWRRALVLALIALLVVAGIAGALGLGLPGIRILFGPAASPSPSIAVPSASPSSSPSPSPTGGAALELGRRVSLAEAQAAIDFAIMQPRLADLAPPDEVWLEGSGQDGVVSLVWLAQDGQPAAPGTNVRMLLTEFRGSVDPGLFTKILEPGTTVEAVQVGGELGYWITGKPHQVVVRVPNGDARGDRVRLAGNVLLWTQAPLTLRLETTADKDEAVLIANSVR